MTRASLRLQDSSFGAAAYQTSRLLRLAVQEHSAPGWSCVSFNAQIMAPYKLITFMMLKAFLTETSSFTNVSFTNYKWLLTADSSLSRGSALNAPTAELNLCTERALQCPLPCG